MLYCGILFLQLELRIAVVLVFHISAVLCKGQYGYSIAWLPSSDLCGQSIQYARVQ